MDEFQPKIHPWNQEIWQVITNEAERANHALLFHGEIGLGKRDLAQALAHFVMTTTSQAVSLFAAGSHPDLHVLTPETEVSDDQAWLAQFAQRYFETHSGKPKKQITVDQVRRLTQAMQTHSHISPTRVVLILSCEQMNNAAANALLKNLEEPPANTLFVLVSDELNRLPATIRSRCSLIAFRPPDHDSAVAYLNQEASIPAAEVPIFLSMANNQPLFAIELHRAGHIEILKQIFGEVNGLWMQRSEPISVAESWLEQGSKKVVGVLQKLATDLLRCQLSSAPRELFYPVQKPWIDKSAQKLSKQNLLMFIDDLSEAKRLLNTSVDERLVLETLCIKVGQLPA